MGRARHFRAALERLPGKLGWTIARVPFDPIVMWPERNRMRVKGKIGEHSFRSSLFSDERGHFLLVNKQMQQGGGAVIGGHADFVLEPDLDEREPLIAEELTALLRQHKQLKKFYETLSDSARNDIYKYISTPKSVASRKKRAEQFAERVMLTLEGEKVTPPILEVAFRREPRARAAWLAMTALQRRGHLMGIFGYQSPESRAKRAAKAVQEALRMAGEHPAKNNGE